MIKLKYFCIESILNSENNKVCYNVNKRESDKIWNKYRGKVIVCI